MTESAPGRYSDLVVVGGGPRALYALADLDEELARSSQLPARPLRVTVLEPGVPGAGAVWDPSQPSHLMMNVDAAIVDATSPSVPWTYHQWSGGDEVTFPSRADVGRYLSWSFEHLCQSPRLEIIHWRARVTSVRRDGAGWVCETSTDHGRASISERSARVLLATGHAGGIGLDHSALTDPTRGPAPSEPVVIHGAALTAFDVVMDLTVGRGGTWESNPDAPAGNRYVPSGMEPSKVTMVSRTGETMLPKPVTQSADLTQAVREETSRWERGATADDAWWEVLADAAIAAAKVSGVTVRRDELWSRVGHAGSAQTRPDLRWHRDLARATGEVDEDPAWWWGRAWAAGYADVVRSLERAPRKNPLWSRWRTRAATLERWAFGPPLETFNRLVALRDAGLLCVVRPADLNVEDPACTIVNAYTRGPGVIAGDTLGDSAPTERVADTEPWAGLLADGLVSVRAGERGVLTMPDGTCVDAQGDAVGGLASLGRPTEDPVIGHDSLQRRLHQDSRRWAVSTASDWTHEVDSTAERHATVGANG
ncbi:FAD/NAD(P)-binding protein [Demequina flava]|uniref:FAD/NAD(P)-binding protein n=1 Tax=Demequina flava TaxID=1095025 RepID=UPI00078455C8|nr:FAD/NAD(P)-binding domain-containing protein [Demequina flava]